MVLTASTDIRVRSHASLQHATHIPKPVFCVIIWDLIPVIHMSLELICIRPGGITITKCERLITSRDLFTMSRNPGLV